jgi:hypothetical protein
MGPYRVSYKGQIESIYIYDAEGKDITNEVSVINWWESDGPNVVPRYADHYTAGKDGKGSAYFPNDQDFYLPSNVAKITINMKQSTVYTADLYFYQPVGKVTKSSGKQRVLIAKPGTTKGEKVSLTIDVQTPEYTELEVEKIAIPGDTPLKGATFVLRHDNRFAKDVEEKDGKFIVNGWTEQFTDAEVDIEKVGAFKFVTPENGKFIIRVKVDKDNQLYALTEIEAPEGFDLTTLDVSKYSKGSIELDESFGTNGIKVNDERMKYKDSKGTSCYFRMKGANGNIQFCNMKKQLLLNVYKIDEDSKEQIPAKFILSRNHQGMQQVMIYAKKGAVEDKTNNTFEVKEWTQNKEEAFQFTTPTSGVLKIILPKNDDDMGGFALE